ncbi:hypothetical protein Tco_0906790 [Tanacetum coccineum]|uniref:Uncharacterized protein n=1 Tax=Tanacetum coccineum TaxID=301880 RepID=A0ABQ5CHN3_9ASTR
MTTLQFADTHNLVTFLSKPTESEGFEQIVDFLNVKTVNGEVQLQALVDRKKIIITESIMRRDLSSLGTSSGSGPRRQETMEDTIAQIRSENVSKHSNDLLLVRAQEITSLKLRVKKLEKKGGSRNLKLKRLYKFSRSIRIVSSNDASLGDQEDAEITLIDETQERYVDDLMFDTGVLGDEEVFAGHDMDEKRLMHDEEVAQRLQAQMQAELEEEDRLVRQREEEANIVSWDNVQAMIDADYQMAQQMQAKEQEKLSIEENSKLFVQLLEERKKYFAKLFNKAMKRVNTFVDIDTELVEGSEVRAEAEIAQVSSSKRAGIELKQERIKKQKVDKDKETTKL